MGLCKKVDEEGEGSSGAAQAVGGTLRVTG